MVARGVTSFKLYLAYRDSMMVDDDDMLAALTASHDCGATIGFHCENGRLVDALVKDALAAGHTTPCFHAATRPAALEAEAVDRLEVIAGLAHAAHYVVHLSSRDRPGCRAPRPRARHHRRGRDVPAVPRARRRAPTAARTTTTSRRRAYVMSPPLRTASDREALWAGLADGDVQFVGTDHCSFDLVGQKDRAADFAHTPNGAPGIELRMALMYSAGVAGGRVGLTRFAEVTATNAARYFGLYPRKGALLPGADADVVVIDPRRDVDGDGG